MTTAIDFLLGALVGFFIIMVFLQLATSKTITAGGYTKKSDNPQRFWLLTLTYLSVSLGAVLVLVFFH